MEQRKVKDNSNQNFSKLAKFLLRKLPIIIIVSVLFATVGLCYSLIRDKTTYTAKKTVMLVLNIAGEADYSYYDGSLSQAYLKDVSYVIKEPTFIATAQEIYGKDSVISSSAISSSITEDSLIFYISYTDKTEQEAVDKLDAVIESAKIKLRDYIKAEDTSLKEMQNRADISQNKTHVKITLIALVVGIAFILILYLLIYLFDNTVKDKEELEEITGAKVFALIDDREYIEKDIKKKQSHAK